jgi:hypothetical protein
MDCQKFPGIVVLRCNGRAYGSVYLITLKVTLRARKKKHTHTHIPTHTHTCSIELALDGSTGGSLIFGIFRVQPTYSIWWPLWLQSMSPWGPFSEYVTRKKIWRVWWLGDDRNIFLGEELSAQQAMRVSYAQTPVPATCRSAFSELHHETFTKLARRNNGNILSRRYDLVVYQSANVKEFRGTFRLNLVLTNVRYMDYRIYNFSLLSLQLKISFNLLYNLHSEIRSFIVEYLD